MKEHRFITFTAGRLFNEARITALNLNAASSLLLNVLHISTTLTHNLSSQVETGDWLQVDGDTRIGPFALCQISKPFRLDKWEWDGLLHGHIHPAQPAARARGGGIVARRPDSGVLSASDH
jgi:hypothetical protein